LDATYFPVGYTLIKIWGFKKVCGYGMLYQGDNDFPACERYMAENVYGKHEELTEITCMLKQVAARNKLKFVPRWGRLVHARYVQGYLQKIK